MLSGTGTDLSMKLEEVYIFMVLQNSRMTQGYVNSQIQNSKVTWLKCPLIKLTKQIYQN